MDRTNNNSNKRLMVSAGSVSALALLVVVACGLGWNKSSSVVDNSSGDNSSSESWIQSVRRKALLYSVLSEIPKDPEVEPVSEEVKEQLAAKYGRWHFWDGDQEDRPENKNLCDEFPPYCDIPGEDFPSESWQEDAVFVNHILNDADGLLSRAMESIFEEYGHPKPKTAEGLSERMQMFHWDKIDLSVEMHPPDGFKKGGKRGNGGWTTKRSFDGLVKRLLHAMMTNGKFTIALAGHSAAAGHGNHFLQSYIMQAHKVLAPVFARLGMKLETHNFSQGGLGTIQNAMASGDLYGKDIDLLLWDSSMTEPGFDHFDLFVRQAMLGGKRVPVIWSAGQRFSVLKKLHEEADVDVGEFGRGMLGIEMTTSEEQAKTLPWAVQYMACDSENADVCKSQDRYCAKCWVDREDGVKPEEPQQEKVAGQVSWHPGWREHQLQGRVIAFAILEALQSAVQEFSDGTMGGPPLADDYWHVGDYYENIQTKLKNLKDGECYKIKEKLPERMCNTAMQGRSQYTPRANSDETSITSILKPADKGYVPTNEKKALYEGPNAHNECYDIPTGEVDVLAVVSGRRRQLNELPFTALHVSTSMSTPTNPTEVATKSLAEATKKLRKEEDCNQLGNTSNITQQQHRNLANIKPGKGWEIVGEPQGYCDGGYYSTCSRDTNHPCVLIGAHDGRGVLAGNGYSGWLVMTLKDLKEGIIVLKVHTWTQNEENTITKDWKSENNERRRMSELEEADISEYEMPTNERNLAKNQAHDDLPENKRNLAKTQPHDDLPENFKFEWAINGKITTLDKKDYINEKKLVQRVIEAFTLLDDPNFTEEATDVEVAVRITGGCGRDCTIGVSHIYWA